MASWKCSLKIAKHYCHKGKISLEDRWKDNKSFIFLILVKEKPEVKEAGKVFSKPTHTHILFVKSFLALNFLALIKSCSLVSALRNVKVGLAVGKTLVLRGVRALSLNNEGDKTGIKGCFVLLEQIKPLLLKQTRQLRPFDISIVPTSCRCLTSVN